MNLPEIISTISTITTSYIKGPLHADTDYFSAIKELIKLRPAAKQSGAREQLEQAITTIYAHVHDEILTNRNQPARAIAFGTSGWRGVLGKDIFCQSVAFVTAAILALYRDAEENVEVRDALGVRNFRDMQQRGCVIGFDNRFDGELLALSVVNVLAANGIKTYYAGEATTGALSAAVLVRQAAFSINLTPSHNPLEYGGFKYNAADAGPAAPILTNAITREANQIIQRERSEFIPTNTELLRPLAQLPGITRINALADWQQLVRENQHRHGLDYQEIISRFNRASNLAVVVDCVHGASRNDIRAFFQNTTTERLIILRGEPDVTFGGIAPEPSSTNMQPAVALLNQRREPLRLGAIIDPDGDRIRFTDGGREITMNQFGAMAYHFLHEIKGKKGMVAKTVATSNLANALAQQLGEEIFEPKVGFKEFKPVLGQALVFFEESDGISIIGHTPEKDAYIGLLLALDMVLTLQKNLSDYLTEIEHEYGAFFPDRDGVLVSQQGEKLLTTLAQLDRFHEGVEVTIGDKKKKISQVITIDGRKMIMEDGSWIMIRPSGTEPKVRFYVEARSGQETAQLVVAAKAMLAEIGLLA